MFGWHWFNVVVWCDWINLKSLLTYEFKGLWCEASEDPCKQPRWGIAGPVLFYLPLAVGFRFPSGVARWTFLVELDGRFASVSGASGFGVKESLLTRPDVAEYFLIGASLYVYKIEKSYMRAKCMGNNCLRWKFRTQKPKIFGLHSK